MSKIRVKKIKKIFFTKYIRFSESYATFLDTNTKSKVTVIKVDCRLASRCHIPKIRPANSLRKFHALNHS